MPLACGYLKATIDQSPALHGLVETRIYNFRGGVTQSLMAKDLFGGIPPDVLGFSVLGWNYRQFGNLAYTFKQFNPAGVVIFGGTHVANQSARVFSDFPQVDIIVNGEGEITFPAIIERILETPRSPNLDGIKGIAYKRPDGDIAESVPESPIADLDKIPSPFLSGAIRMTDSSGSFAYDVALMETNRGCPYKCSFCYWGGAVGQRVRCFSRERLAAELEYFGKSRVRTIVLCDANFGMLESDENFVEELARTKERYGFPLGLETSWAKNKSERFYRIVEKLQQHKLQSSFTLALQSLSKTTLTSMRRRNMRVNDWRDLADWLATQGLECYAELIWGAPGESRESFYDGYDQLAERVPRIAVYPLLILPNTTYHATAQDDHLVTIRGDYDDYQYVLANSSASFSEHLDVQAFMFWARLLGENRFLNHVIKPACKLANMTQSQLFNSVRRTFEESVIPEVVSFMHDREVIASSTTIAHAHRKLYSETILEQLIAHWWDKHILPRFPVEWREFGRVLYEYERLCRPVYSRPGSPLPDPWQVGVSNSCEFFYTDGVEFPIDIQAELEKWRNGRPPNPPDGKNVSYTFRAPAGFYDQIDNHETGVLFSAEVSEKFYY
jgi:radical SAM superfamily enzyme YgiQ (UPF0313 family)